MYISIYVYLVLYVSACPWFSRPNIAHLAFTNDIHFELSLYFSWEQCVDILFTCLVYHSAVIDEPKL